MTQAPIAEASTTARQAAEADMAEHARRHRWRRLLAESDRVLGWLEHWALEGRKRLPAASGDAVISTVERLERAARVSAPSNGTALFEVMERVYVAQERILLGCRWERARIHRRRNGLP